MERKCRPQTNSDDCGVFVAACAASVVLQTPAPIRIDNFDVVTMNTFVISFDHALSTIQGIGFC